MDFNLDLARALQDIIQERGIRQDDVALYLDRSQGYVSHRLTGKNAEATPEPSAAPSPGSTERPRPLQRTAETVGGVLCGLVCPVTDSLLD